MPLKIGLPAPRTASQWMALQHSGDCFSLKEWTHPCPFTSASILRGETLMTVRLETMDGRTYEGVTACRIFGHMGFDSTGSSLVRLPRLEGHSWRQHREELIQQLNSLTSIMVRRVARIDVPMVIGCPRWKREKAVTRLQGMGDVCMFTPQ